MIDTPRLPPYTMPMERRVNWRDHISIDPEICHGKPCFKGTRIMVYLVIEMLEDGAAVQEILEAYPSLTPDSVKAALCFSSEVIQAIRFDSLLPAAR